jgi:small conductance mechanosensitive channel
MTPDNIASYVGNNRLFSDTIQNLSNSPLRRVDRTAQLAHDVDVADAIRRLEAALRAVPNVLATPPPEVRILDFNAMGTVLAVRPYAHNKDYWQVYFDTNQAIATVFGEAHYPTPATRQVLAQEP